MREELGIRLEIFDGQAIATLLADEEHFWIAQRFLGVPAAMAVPSSTSPEWYAAARGRWVDRAHPPSTYGDLDDVTRAARHVVLDDGPIVDLELWLGTLRRSSVADGDHLQRSAFYQLALLSLRGTESLHGLEDELSRYFDKAADLTGTGELEDAEVLLTMVAVAARVGQATIEPQTIDEWRERLGAHIASEVDEATTPGRRCELLFVFGGMCLVAPGEGMPYAPEALDAALNAWSELVSIVDEVPFFPLIRLSNVMSVLTPALFDRPTYSTLIDELDVRVEARSGRSRIAEVQRDRAVQLFHAGRPDDALDEFHRVRVGWFAADTIRGSLLAMATMINCYEQLGLHMAAKYHALGGAGTALSRSDDDVADIAGRVLFGAAYGEFVRGNWLSATELADAAIFFYDELNVAPWDEEDEMRDFSIQVLAHSYGFAVAFAPEVAATLERSLTINGWIEQFPAPGPWAGRSEEEATENFVEQIGAVPFGDAGIDRVVAWSALGIEWRVSFANEYETTMAAERLIASLQMPTNTLRARSDIRTERLLHLLSLPLAGEPKPSTSTLMPCRCRRERASTITSRS
jgi:hypothetical protein